MIPGGSPPSLPVASVWVCPLSLLIQMPLSSSANLPETHCPNVGILFHYEYQPHFFCPLFFSRVTHIWWKRQKCSYRIQSSVSLFKILNNIPSRKVLVGPTSVWLPEETPKGKDPMFCSMQTDVLSIYLKIL